MKRVDDMAARLPQLYRDGELLRGSRFSGGVLEVPASELEMADEIAREIQRMHWFDRTYELEHAAMLAALLDLPPQPWQDLDTYRPWVHALRDAMLKEGGVTVDAIQSFISVYAEAFESATGVDAVGQVGEWTAALAAPTAPANASPAFIEYPRVRRVARFPSAGALEPLSRFNAVNRGFTESALSFLMTGTSMGREAAPLIANLTTGEALLFADEVPEGKRLWIRANGATLAAQLEDEDVTAKLRFVANLEPGKPVTTADLTAPAKPLTLRRGTNELWFFPLALFDVRGLDRYLFSMPDLALTEGRFDTSAFDHALFYQQPLMVLFASWLEESPATFEAHLPAAILRSERPASEARARRTLLGSALSEGVEKLRAAGVAAMVALDGFGETQRQLDRLRFVMPVHLSEYGSTGADRITERGGTFDLTTHDESTFR
ncbi:MAG TPA: hypothetical protein VNI54_01585 [Thermoanaerobaculia bacterium]|nr:hypothetical protein [Thermoanaerobaculia bacterium]